MEKITKPLQCVFNRDAEFQIVLFGCGGTGSFIAWDIARLMWHIKEEGRSIEALFVDFDKVEDKNVGRQNFPPCDIGRNKAESLSTRFNRAYGLGIAYFDGRIQEWQPALERHEYRGVITILIGAVDNTEARAAILEHVNTYERFHRNVFWLDCGNSESAGQVLIGNSEKMSDDFKKSSKIGLCSEIPLPHILHPELVRKEKAVKKHVSCADLAVSNAQSLMINRAVSTFAGQYLYDILIKRTLIKHATYVSLSGGSTTSKFLNKDIWDKNGKR